VKGFSLKRPASSSFWARSLGARSSDLCPEPTGLARLELAQASAHQFCQKVSGFNPFSPKIPNFDISNAQNLSQKMFTGLIHKKTLKDTQNLKLKHHFIIIQPTSPNFQQQQQFSSSIHIYEYPMH